MSKMFKLWQTIKSFIYFYIRCLIKIILRKTTKLCELQRICYADNCGSVRTKSVGLSIIFIIY
jgi:hypothetical protein